MQYNSTLLKNVKWRLCHAFNDFIGSGSLLLASVFTFPIFQQYFDIVLVPAWFYIIGSAALVIANFMLWRHYGGLACKGISINQSIVLFAFMCYVAGSIKLRPGKRRYDDFSDAASLFRMGSALLFIAQMWKLYRTLRTPGKKCSEQWKENKSQILIHLFSMIGALTMFFGITLYNDSVNLPHLLDESSALLSLGSLFFFMSSCYLQKQYFWQTHSINEELGSEEMESMQ